MMQLYLLRHAVAVPSGTKRYPKDDRPLTEEGIRKMKKNALGIANIVPEVDMIISSPLKRALRTAKIAASALGYSKPIARSRDLMPDANLNLIIDELVANKMLGRVLIVGHNPHLEKLASLLMGAGAPALVMKKGGICRIDIEELPLRKPCSLIWHLPPRLLRMLS
jgi:phosphohistidine phosphatase